MGRFGQLRADQGSGCYIISDTDWAAISRETTEAIKDIPSAFVGAIPDLINARESFTAEIWAFWFMYIAPIVLRGRFADVKYYNHMCDLIDIMKVTLQFEISRAELENLRKRIITWVQHYEELYYQFDVTRLSTCLLVVHGLLHIVDDILYAGPGWATWTFFMERFCGHLKRALRSRAYPWSHLDRRVANIAHLAHLRARYDLEEELDFFIRLLLMVLLIDPLTYLHAPCLSKYQPGQDIRRHVAVYLAGVVGGQVSRIVQALPEIMPAWGKLRIGHGGDSMRAVIAQQERFSGRHERNSSFVRYELLAKASNGYDIREIHYGELQGVLECYLDPEQQPIWGDSSGATLLLTLIRPCKTNGEDAAITVTHYRDVRADIIIDVQAIQAVIGRVKSRKRWGIIDRSNGLARTVFYSGNFVDGDSLTQGDEDENFM
ncbi:hypothetical protein C8Q79DRAFT_908784 [Trametes meyenii]|nr:hypothetical protein C8Q79DRAFT_908784 [Trametes meyenii]